MRIYQDNDMSQKQQFVFISTMMLLVIVACQISGNSIPTPVANPTQLATDLPLFALPTPTVNAVNDLQTKFPSFSLTDPNTVCVQHYLQALSFLDATGWHIYKDGNIPRSIIHCADGRIYLVDDEIYQYQIEGETLASIGGWVDQGAVLCGRKMILGE